ncbi:MAG: lipoate--protein ligase family protein [Candidatus Jordarchaeum sp.]|uniref:lipoate--protein ligase family protein n=1 Tax=Candidatus Jordarchaeum sp. TaxID=2823881 RepID=UPI00404A1010
MAKEWRFILDVEGTAAKPLTASMSLLSSRAANKTPNTALVMYWPKPCITFGYFQDIDTDFDLELAKKYNIELARRMEGMGGGTIFLDTHGFMGLAMSVDKETYPTMKDAFNRTGEALTEVYRMLGVEDAKYYPPDDVRAEASGRKVGAVGITELFGYYIVNSSNMPGYIRDDILIKVAKIPAEKFKDKKLKTFDEYQGGVEAETGYCPNPYEFAGAVYKAFEDILGIEFKPGWYTKEELDQMALLNMKAMSEEHTFARSSKRKFAGAPKDYKVAIGKYKARKLVESRILVDPKGVIKDMFFAGDFYAKPVPILREMEESFKGVSINDDDAMLKKIKAAYEKPGWETSEISPEDFLKALIAGRESLKK